MLTGEKEDEIEATIEDKSNSEPTFDKFLGALMKVPPPKNEKKK